MIVLTLSLILFIIFTVLGGFHFYWLFGGIWGLENAIPTKIDKANTLAIPKLVTLMVALVLISFGLIYLMESGLLNLQVPIPKAFERVINYGTWIIPSVFILRAIGDFNYVGFFKKIKNTTFGKSDSKLFSPLCLAIGLMGLLIQLIN
jgi:hypothetical protein